MLKEHCGDRIAAYTKLLLYVDGGCEPKNPGGVATSGWVFYDEDNPESALVEAGEIAQDGGPLATNNYGEYCSLVFALKYLQANAWRGSLVIKGDSKLLIEQVNGRWKCNMPHLQKLRSRIYELFESLELAVVTEDDPLPPEGMKSVSLHHVDRKFNQRANDLCRIAYKEYREEK